MGNGGLSQVIGIEGVCLDTGNGMKVMLKDVKNAPNVHLKFISAGRLDDKGYLNIMGESKWKLTKGSLVIARGNMYSNLYFMQASISNGTINVVENANQVLIVLKQFQASVERRIGNKLKCIRTDNGGEYSGPFDQYCKSQGVIENGAQGGVQDDIQESMQGD
ncbi:hypothetical protein GH714_002780 [Hevea brasiliensis]|uniref:Integrase catalytic domain-containing protein n=1 Tax=Hevea brasiliensis TaxID=3981 RepID=A0A6A6N0V9_HEVBR|nr:hypothetical protein GH714_002780 [Hevea brasiliensis]